LQNIYFHCGTIGDWVGGENFFRYPTPLEQGAEISLKTLQIICNPFGINACAKLFAPKSSRMVRFGPENHRENPVFAQ
jgi:hypothetical protein